MRELKPRYLDLPPVRLPAVTIGSLALGALAFGALAIGALAIARLAIGRATVTRAHFGEVEIDDLTVRRLRVIATVPPEPPKKARAAPNSRRRPRA